MTNNDISLLKYCFSVAGHKNQRETTGWLYKVSKCLQNAGAENILIDEKKEELLFQVNNGRMSGKKDIIQYKVKIMSGSNQIALEQVILWSGETRARKLMSWYAARRNEKLANGIRYSRDPIQLKGQVILRDGWEKELIRRTGDMNRIVMSDRDIFEALNRGNVPECIQNRVRQEYQEYEREISYGINI